MSNEFLTPKAAAERLGISVTTLYDWLGKSDCGLFVMRGRAVTIAYLQGGPKGQGRIRIAATEVERILDLMRVQPQHIYHRQTPVPQTFPGITVPLGHL